MNKLELIGKGLNVLQKDGFGAFIRSTKHFFANIEQSRLIEAKGKRLQEKGNTAFTWKTYNDLVSDTLKLNIDDRYDAVVGIPRSGMMAATILATKYGKALATPDTLINGKWWQSKNILDQKLPRRILLVDDSCASGYTISKVKSRLRECCSVIDTAAIYITEEVSPLIKYYAECFDAPAQFEWSIAHQMGYFIERPTFDIDGVLCEDYTGQPDYENWLRNVSPLILPKYRIPLIITNRKEQYRQVTTDWLARYNVKYDKLLMWDDRQGSLEDNKVRHLQNHNTQLMYESNKNEAIQIAAECKIPVICFEDRKLYQL